MSAEPKPDLIKRIQHEIFQQTSHTSMPDELKVVLLKLDDVKELMQSWRYLHSTSFQRPNKRDEDGKLILGEYEDYTTMLLNAARLDGTDFAVHIQVGMGEFSDPRVVGSRIQIGLDTLESYRTCSCVVHAPCKMHKPTQMFL